MSLITLTHDAISHIKSMVAKKNGVGFRLSIKKTGCSGYAYVPDVIETVREKDIHFTQDDLEIYIDPQYESIIKNIIVDYVTDPNSLGLKQKQLVFINPNEKNRCGCGESFTIE